MIAPSTSPSSLPDPCPKCGSERIFRPIRSTRLGRTLLCAHCRPCNAERNRLLRAEQRAKRFGGALARCLMLDISALRLESRLAALSRICGGWENVCRQLSPEQVTRLVCAIVDANQRARAERDRLQGQIETEARFVAAGPGAEGAIVALGAALPSDRLRGVIVQLQALLTE